MRQMYTVGTLFFGLALSIKMNALLYLPAIGFVLLQGLGVMRALRQSLLVLQLQVLFQTTLIALADSASACLLVRFFSTTLGPISQMPLTFLEFSITNGLSIGVL